MATKNLAPIDVRIRMYQVGFGDCFLLTFRYPAGFNNRHVLIDFGTTAAPKNTGPGLLKRIAQSISDTVGNDPFAVVATHRHADHIAGFDPGANNSGSGAIIRALKPKLVVQPWTEEADLAIDAVSPNKRALATQRRSLMQMQAVAKHVSQNIAPRLIRSSSTKAIGEQLRFLGDDNLSNPGAVKNLMTMGPNDYVYAGKKTRLSRFLPGVKVDILGPPTIAQHASVRSQKRRNESEYWHLQARTLTTPISDLSNERFNDGPDGSLSVRGTQAPPWARWVIRSLKNENAAETLSLVRVLDKAMNNTSIIMLMEAGDKKLLFPGDAQIENWEFALNEPKLRAKLDGVSVYKVGHHGSLNASPKSLLNQWFKPNKGAGKSKKKMISMLSTREHLHGDPLEKTEVPRKTLVAKLKGNTKLVSTQSMTTDFHEEIITF